MVRRSIVTSAAAIAVAAGVLAYRSQSPSSEILRVPLATPPGVTLHSVRAGPLVATGIANGKQMAPRFAYADARGHTAYTFDKDVDPSRSACAADCAKTWAPVEAPAGAKPFGEWSIVARDDGVRQWAVRGKPLYRFLGDTAVGQAKGGMADSAFHVAIFDPAGSLPAPDGISARDLAWAGGVGIVNEQGMTLYVFDGTPSTREGSLCADARCASRWKPVPAPFVARPVGDFTVVAAADGSDQWAYRGKPLFAFDGDTEPGDVNGSMPDKGWRPALLVRYFMPDGVIIRHNHFGGENLATAQGMTLYAQDASSYMQGHSLRRGVPLVEATARELGGSRCDADCLKTWLPLTAPADAEPSGFWGVILRSDGSRQWAYSDYPLHRYAGDKRPGDMNGNDIYDYLPGEDLLKSVSLPPQMPHGSAALVWRAVTP